MYLCSCLHYGQKNIVYLSFFLNIIYFRFSKGIVGKKSKQVYFKHPIYKHLQWDIYVCVYMFVHCKGTDSYSLNSWIPQSVEQP